MALAYTAPLARPADVPEHLNVRAFVTRQDGWDLTVEDLEALARAYPPSNAEARGRRGVHRPREATRGEERPLEDLEGFALDAPQFEDPEAQGREAPPARPFEVSADHADSHASQRRIRVPWTNTTVARSS